MTLIIEDDRPIRPEDEDLEPLLELAQDLTMPLPLVPPPTAMSDPTLDPHWVDLIHQIKERIRREEAWDFDRMMRFDDIDITSETSTIR